LKKFGLSQQERIKQSKEIEKVFSAGKVFFVPSKRIRAIYLLTKDPSCSVKVAFAVSKRAGNAVWRNRVKRVLREAYRLNKTDIIEKAASSGKSALIVFSPGYLNQKKHKKIFFGDLVNDVKLVLLKVSEEF